MTGNTPGRILRQYGSPAANKVVLIQQKSQAAGRSPAERDCNAAVYVLKRLKSVSFTAAVVLSSPRHAAGLSGFHFPNLARPSCERKKKKKNLRQIKMSTVERRVSQSESV